LGSILTVKRISLPEAIEQFIVVRKDKTVVLRKRSQGMSVKTIFGVNQAGLAGVFDLVPTTGLEPITIGFLLLSFLLMCAFLVSQLYANIWAFPSYCKHCFASFGKHGQKNLCGIVRLCGNCAVAILA
jgi:hypothetical protein